MSVVMDPLVETVILLHGTGRSPRSLAALEKRLTGAGYSTCNLAYPWRDRDIAGLAHFVADALKAKGLTGPTNKLHFVTHSMGGLVAAYLLGTQRDRLAAAIGRVVMLGPPLGGSEVADALCKLPMYRWMYGPAGQDLVTTSGLLDNIRPDYPLGIIAGTVGWPYLSGLIFIREANDGRVSVARTRWDGMADHLIMPVTHSFMPTSPHVQAQVLHFLQTGTFRRP
ncbi:alpha/beta fold hydrolase [Asticcacaulis sp. 201]|uniref:alpha/beta fold hydrolase n=1 Tax=Asticcacaulis sp. 201 TaxID=3028787 RepID=UPI002916F4F1|nr:alpha/beta fold hydrolase [Asticcacaulis sp. 201]MDV6332198.1 alpha/beta fold hydrolase [Asticcacaulis sp. 201]